MATTLLAVLLAPVAASTQLGIDARLRALSGIGIWYFYLSTCPYCMRQEPILHALASRYDIPVTPISLDGGPPPAHAFDDYTYDQGQAARLGVRVTPTLYLVHPETAEAALLSTGLTAGPALKRRIVHAAEVAGWLSEPASETRATVTSSDERASGAGGAADEITDSILKRLHAGRRW